MTLNTYVFTERLTEKIFWNTMKIFVHLWFDVRDFSVTRKSVLISAIHMFFEKYVTCIYTVSGPVLCRFVSSSVSEPCWWSQHLHCVPQHQPLHSDEVWGEAEVLTTPPHQNPVTAYWYVNVMTWNAHINNQMLLLRKYHSFAAEFSID